LFCLLSFLLDKASAGHHAVEELVGDLDEGNGVKNQRWQVRFKQRNKGITPQFEEHVRCTLATGATARQVQDMLILDANYMLAPEAAGEFCDSLPQQHCRMANQRK
jgi:hypothetical protein